AKPGTVMRFDPTDGELPKNVFRHSSHQFGVAEAIEMARVLGRLPEHIVVYGIEGKSFDLGAGLSDGVEDGVLATVEAIKQDIIDWV
ncbi:MAG: hydrogenase maturation protease, partial [Alphaproteobacteria bacterium]|nr:hydrogenase maturation protease [Alphaproteobacteria bacterium]